MRDAKGNFYGTTSSGGYYSQNQFCGEVQTCGTVFKLSRNGSFVVLHTFTGYPNDGGNSYAGLVMDKAGNLYGTTTTGGPYNVGTAFKVTQAGTETVLHSFTDYPDGAAPYASLVMDKHGNLFGTTYLGGTGLAGVVFQVTP